MPERDGIEISDEAVAEATEAIRRADAESEWVAASADASAHAALEAAAPLIVADELERLADCIRAEAADPGNGWLSNETYRAGKIHAALKARAAALRSASAPTQESDHVQ